MAAQSASEGRSKALCFEFSAGGLQIISDKLMYIKLCTRAF